MITAPVLPLLLAILAAAIFALLGALHVYWAGGGNWGAAAAFPEEWRQAPAGPSAKGGLRLHRPTPLNTLAVAVALFAATAVMLGRVGWLPLVPGWIFTTGTWVLALIFLARAIGDFHTIGFFKSRRGALFATSKFATWDSRLFSPLCLAIAALAAGVAVLAP